MRHSFVVDTILSVLLEPACPFYSFITTFIPGMIITGITFIF